MRSPARSVAVGAALMALASPSPGQQQDEIYYATFWNGYRVYLSPAVHDPSFMGDECNTPPDENTMAYWIAYDAAQGNYYSDVANTTSDGRNLTARGYDVRIGTGTIQSAVNNSNAWPATLHIPIHSNADLQSAPTAAQCARTNPAGFGTHVIYRTGRVGSDALAVDLLGALGPASPGTNDMTCYNPNHPCTSIDLYELRVPTAIPAYIEAEFHTWTTGTTWLWDEWWWRWRIGVGVDQYLGYP
jgi:hypothetical protein